MWFYVKSIESRLAGRWEPEPNTGCWLWIGSVINRRRGVRGSYGVIRLSPSTALLAHRASYMVHVGPVPASACVMHVCDTPPCVNPDHLRLGTVADNNADMAHKLRHGQARLTPDIVREVRASDEPHTVLARRYGVSPRAITFCRNGITWRHV